MAVLKDARAERAVQLHVKGKSQVAAYKEAGYSVRNAAKNATKFWKRKEVKARVAELQERLAGKVIKSRAQVLGDLARNADTAYDKDQIGASTQALKLYGQEAHNMFVNKHLVGTGPLEEMTETQKRALLGIGPDDPIPDA